MLCLPRYWNEIREPRTETWLLRRVVIPNVRDDFA